jgi:hypothetical protein
MVDLTAKTIRGLFDRQVQDLTRRSAVSKEELFDYQLSGGWLR